MIDIKTRVENFKKFYNMENERILFGFFYDNEYPLKRYRASKNLPEDRALISDDFVVENYLEDYERLYKKHEECGGDFIYSASAFWGIPWMEAIMGCPIYADHKTGSIYSKPPEKTEVPEFSENNKWVQKSGEFLEKLAKHSRGRFPLATTRMRGIADLLSALYDGENFVFEMMDNPEKIKDLAYKLTKLFISTGKYQLMRIPDFYGGIGSFYYHNWAPKGTIWNQEDAAALISPALYEEFIYPCDEQIVKAFDGVIIHQHSTGFVPTESYIKMGMLALELHIDTGGPSAEELYDRHMTIMRDKPLIIWGDIPDKDLDWIFSKLPHKGLAVNTVVESPERADELWKKYIKGGI